MEIKCAQCGSALKPGSLFCSQCGLAFTQPVPMPMATVVPEDAIRAKGVAGGEIILYNNRVVLRKGPREQEVFLHSIRGVEYRRASMFRGGYIEIITGSLATGRTVFDKVASGQIAVYYSTREQKSFDILRESLSTRIAQLDQNKPS